MMEKDESDSSTINIPYSGNLGKQVEEVSIDAKKIDLYLRTISAIDLAEVSRLKNLECLDLSFNRLESIDLSGLSTCRKIRDIRLQHNNLSSLNLWPLIYSNNPEFVDISNNEIESIDLTAVFHWKAVATDPGLQVQFDPCLRYLPQVLGKTMIDERTKHRDPLAIVTFNDYESAIRTSGWNHIRNRIKEILQKITPKDWFAFQRGMLEGLGISELACYDGDPFEILRFGFEEDDYDRAKINMYTGTVSLLEKQIERNGPTTFLDIRKMLETEACTLVPKIIERRKEEIEYTVIPQIDDRVILMPLWITANGHSILSALELGLRTNSNVLQIIREQFAKLDQELHVLRDGPIKDSYGLECTLSYRRHIAQIVQHNQPPPRYISSRKL
ncbi:MAG: hypothetical protein GF411_03525 [Candidatus Lokiarchaeota archaeon]|nr:hypothetical protein [Candidatus Lokiarchaeota archaeon]